MAQCAKCSKATIQDDGTVTPGDWLYRPDVPYTAYFAGQLLCGDCEALAAAGDHVTDIHNRISPGGDGLCHCVYCLGKR